MDGTNGGPQAGTEATTKGNGSPRPRRLGRGLSAIVDVGHRQPPTPTTRSGVSPIEPPIVVDPKGGEAPQGVRELPVGVVKANDRQPRQVFDEGALAQLAESIREHGVLQPILVRGERDGRFELIAGERRLRASQLAGLKTIPAIVREIDNRTSAEWALLENLQREDLNPVEKARGLRALIDGFGVRQEDAGRRGGLDRSSVANLLRLLALDEMSLALIEASQLGAGHGKALLTVTDPHRRAELATRAARESWSVRETERRCKDAASARPPSGTPTPGTDAEPTRREAAVADLEKRLAAHLGTRVRVRAGRGSGGRIEIEYFDFDQLDGVLDRIGFPRDEQ